MKQKPIGLSQRYVTALRKHLKPGPRERLPPALGLGRQAVARELETLELRQPGRPRAGAFGNCLRSAKARSS